VTKQSPLFSCRLMRCKGNVFAREKRGKREGKKGKEGPQRVHPQCLGLGESAVRSKGKKRGGKGGQIPGGAPVDNGLGFAGCRMVQRASAGRHQEKGGKGREKK